MINAILKEALPLLPVKIKAPDFGCTAFTLTDTDGKIHMGRNYDFSKDTSAMMVYCAPKDGYKSISALLFLFSGCTPGSTPGRKHRASRNAFGNPNGRERHLEHLPLPLWL